MNAPSDTPVLPAPTRRATVVILDSLTEQEAADRAYYEQIADAGFAQAYEALARIRDGRLYRSTHGTFEAYCADRYGKSARWGRYMASAVEITARIVAALASATDETGGGIEVATIPGTIVPLADGSAPSPFTPLRVVSVPTRLVTPVIPTAPSQLRPLAGVSHDAQPIVWQRAVERAGGKVPTAAQVTRAVEDERARAQVNAARYAMISHRMNAGLLTPQEALVIVNALDSIPAVARPVVLRYNVRDRAVIHELGRLCKAKSATYDELVRTGWLQFAEGRAVKLDVATAVDLRTLLDERRQEHIQTSRDAKIDGTPVSVVVYIGDAAATVRSLRNAGFVERDLRTLADAVVVGIAQRRRVKASILRGRRRAAMEDGA